MIRNHKKKEAEKVLSEMTNPKRLGPGVWYSFMLNSAKAKTKNELLFICKQIRDFCNHFGCMDCRNHAQEYLKRKAPEDKASTSDTLFRWVVDFMNAVQIRLRKPVYDYQTLHDLFFIEEFVVCTSSCGGAVPDDDEFIEIKIPDDQKIRSNGLFNIVPLSDSKGRKTYRTVKRASRS